MAQALLPPPAPDGGYPGGNTAGGEGALFNVNVDFGTDNTAVGLLALNHNTTGVANSAVGALALRSNTTGPWNTAIGVATLLSNTTGSSNTATGSLRLKATQTATTTQPLVFKRSL